MLFASRRFSANSLLRSRLLRGAFTAGLVFSAPFAHAVVVRGRVIDALGKPVPRARVQLIEAGKVVTMVYSDDDGSYEIRSFDTGRFTLLTSAAGFLPGIGKDFYGRAVDVVPQDVVLSSKTVRQEVTVTETGVPTPPEQLTAPVSLIASESLATRVAIVDELRQAPGIFLVQTGQVGSQTSMFVRGGQSDANKVLIDGIPAEDIGGRFDFGTVSSTGIANIEMLRGPNSALYGSDALASVVSITTPRGSSLRPVLNYSGDAGTLHTYRNEASLSGTYSRFDYYGAFSRFETANAVKGAQYHSSTAAANLGYNFTSRLQLRGTIRSAVSAAGVPNAHDFFGISADQRQGDQDIYAQGTLDHRTRGDWHNMVRYGIARKREQFNTYSFPAATASFGTYYGKVMTIRGANGYSTTGQAAIGYDPLPAGYLNVSNRDELYYQSDRSFTRHASALFGFRYENERGAYRYPVFGSDQALQRTNFQYTGQVQADIKNRVFFSMGGAIEKNQVYGLRGTPRLGIAWAAARPSERKFHGTRLRAEVSRGVQEPSLAVQFSSLYAALQSSGNTAAISAFNVNPVQALEGRTYDIAVEQNVLKNLAVKGGYFHAQYDHQVEYVESAVLQRYFGIQQPGCTPAGASACALPNFYGAYLNSLTYRAQGAEFEAQYQPTQHIFIRGGYTYLAPIVQRSFSSDALRAAGSTVNPLFPGITIGASSPLVGQRPFRRAPNTGFLSAQYARQRFGVAFRGAFAGKSDDSTFLTFSTPAFDNTLLLPNRNLDFGYAKLDMSGTYNVLQRVTLFAQAENLLNNQHIGPIGYPGLPLTARAGVKVRLGGD